MRYWPLVLLTLVACDDVVSERQIAAPYTTVEERSCSYSCVTYGCGGLNFDGSFGRCGMGMHSCHGDRTARVQHTPMERTYESGKVRQYDKEIVLEYLSRCN